MLQQFSIINFVCHAFYESAYASKQIILLQLLQMCICIKSILWLLCSTFGFEKSNSCQRYVQKIRNLVAITSQSNRFTQHSKIVHAMHVLQKNGSVLFFLSSSTYLFNEIINRSRTKRSDLLLMNSLIFNVNISVLYELSSE